MKLSVMVGQTLPNDIEVENITSDSRTVTPGDVFVLDTRQTTHPHDPARAVSFVRTALEKGAARVVVDGPLYASLPGDLKAQAVAVPMPGAVAAAWYRHKYPRQPQTLVAVTGTNGKTSVAWFYREIAGLLGHKSASIGTLGVYEGRTLTKELGYTAPAPATLYKTLHELAENGVTYAAMEVSSHALVLGRADRCTFTAAGFTNITQDHLDFHQTMENYLVAKGRLFSDLVPEGAGAVLVSHRPAAAPLIAMAKVRGLDVLTVGPHAAELLVRLEEAQADGLHLLVKYAAATHHVTVPVMGAFQAENLAVAMGLALKSGFALDDVLRVLPQVASVPGRMEVVPSGANQPTVVVDYAHTSDALETAIKAIRPQVRGKLWVVFGCGGDRDKTKRPLMGGVVARLADHAVVTDDNPRSEDPATIRAQVMAACPGGIDMGDRARAIAHAITHAGPDDVVLVAGKGHESGQVMNGVTEPFDDRVVAKNILNRGPAA